MAAVLRMPGRSDIPPCIFKSVCTDRNARTYGEPLKTKKAFLRFHCMENCFVIKKSCLKNKQLFL